MKHSATRIPTARDGLSLLELLAVITLLSIISAIIIPRIGGHTLTTKKEACSQYKADINSMVERYHFNNGVSPTALSDLEGADYYDGPIPPCPLTGAAYTLDGTTGRVVGHDH